MTIEQLKYPIGKFEAPKEITAEMLSSFIQDISLFPSRLRQETANLSSTQLDSPYRPEGWTIRQLVHHCADSHMNSLIRFKLALTEENPTIKPYFEDRWAELPDGRDLPVEPSVKMLEGIHERWTHLLNSLSPEQLARTYIHPEQDRELRLDHTIALYAWHCRHHLAHVTGLKEREGWE